MTAPLQLSETVQGDGETLLIAHGLFGSARNWGVVAKRLADARRVVTVDMRNHGASPWSDAAGYPGMASDLGAAVGRHGGTADLLGHSMGGKAAMQLALTRPEAVRRLIVADIAPVAYDHSQSHLIAAMRVIGTEFASRADADAALSVHVPEAGVRAFLLQSLDLREGRWRLNLDALEAHMDAITGWPGTDGIYEGPALFLSGAASDYVRREHRAGILAQFPKARFAKIPGAGHWLHAERPREFEAAVRTFLDRA